MIGISLIIKDDSESEYLEKLLVSLRERAQDTFITITNNPSSEIKKIINKYGAHWNFFQWINDFSAARQYGFDHLPEKYSFIFTCDADDVIENVDKLGSMVSRMKKHKVDTCYVTYITSRDKEHGDTIVNVPRLVKRNSGKWVRPIHEVWVSNDRASFIIGGPRGTKCIHTKVDIESGERRNLDMLLSIKNKTDEDRRYIASSYITLGNVDEALKYLLEIKPEFGFYYDVLITIANIYKWKRNLDEGIKTLEGLVREFPEYSDPYFALGSYLIDAHQYERALETYLEGFKRPKMRQIMTTSSHETYINPLGKVAFLYETLGQHDKALWCVEVLKKISPDLNKVKELENIINGNG